MVFLVSCVVTIEYYYPGDSCPGRPKDCFIFSDSFISVSPIDQFVCNPDDTIKTPNSTSVGHILCYGYVLNQQSTLDIMNQLGICTGILAVLSIFFTFLYRISHHSCGLIFTVLLLLGILVIVTLFGTSKIKADILRYYLVATAMIICMTTILLKYLATSRRRSVGPSTT